MRGPRQLLKFSASMTPLPAMRRASSRLEAMWTSRLIPVRAPKGRSTPTLAALSWYRRHRSRNASTGGRHMMMPRSFFAANSIELGESTTCHNGGYGVWRGLGYVEMYRSSPVS